jgi:hypothetical protein
MKKEPKKTSLSLDPELYRAAKVRAAQEGKTVRDVVEAALRAYLAESRHETALRYYKEVVIPAAVRSKGGRHGAR